MALSTPSKDSATPPTNITDNKLNMANVKKSNLTTAPQWWKHLKEFKRVFWKAERKAHREAIKCEVTTTTQIGKDSR